MLDMLPVVRNRDILESRLQCYLGLIHYMLDLVVRISDRVLKRVAEDELLHYQHSDIH